MIFGQLTFSTVSKFSTIPQDDTRRTLGSGEHIKMNSISKKKKKEVS
jgi:hypothetical protein